MRSPPKLCRAADSLLVIIDIQTRLGAAMPGGVRDRVVENAASLAQAASTLAIPLVVTRQYPQGLGDTEPDIPVTAAAVIDKTVFSCFRSEEFRHALENHGRPQIVLAGMESHICVLQTALDLQAAGYQVFVAEDAVCSRSVANHRNAMSRLEQAGVMLTNSESCLFEWLEDAAHPQFKQLSSLIK